MKLYPIKEMLFLSSSVSGLFIYKVVIHSYYSFIFTPLLHVLMRSRLLFFYKAVYKTILEKHIDEFQQACHNNTYGLLL